MTPRAAWNTFDHYAYGAIALAGTGVAILVLWWLMGTASWQSHTGAMAAIVGPFINVQGILFGLTLAFLANDTWTAHEKARSAVLDEADSLRSLDIMVSAIPAGESALLRAAVRDYAVAAAAEWKALARCETSPAATRSADELLDRFAAIGASAPARSELAEACLRLIAQIRARRAERIGLSRTHVNPLKWASMAFLGFITLASIAAIHADTPDAALVAMVLFGLASAPVAAIVLVHGNPFQPPFSTSPASLIGALADRP
jgi:hypothetical protein